MGRSISSKLESSRKFLEKNSKSTLNLKQAQAMLSNVEKVSAELSSLRTRLGELVEARKSSIIALDEAMAKVKLEKKLKQKEAKVQAKLAILSSPPAPAK
jgi:flagellar motor switch/type III secretory pathway protein FliN